MLLTKGIKRQDTDVGIPEGKREQGVGVWGLEGSLFLPPLGRLALAMASWMFEGYGEYVMVVGMMDGGLVWQDLKSLLNSGRKRCCW